VIPVSARGHGAAPETATGSRGKVSRPTRDPRLQVKPPQVSAPTVPRRPQWLPEDRTRIKRFTPQHSRSRSREHRAHPLHRFPTHTARAARDHRVGAAPSSRLSPVFHRAVPRTPYERLSWTRATRAVQPYIRTVSRETVDRYPAGLRRRNRICPRRPLPQRLLEGVGLLVRDRALTRRPTEWCGIPLTSADQGSPRGTSPVLHLPVAPHVSDTHSYSYSYSY